MMISAAAAAALQHASQHQGQAQQQQHRLTPVNVVGQKPQPLSRSRRADEDRELDVEDDEHIDDDEDEAIAAAKAAKMDDGSSAVVAAADAGTSRGSKVKNEVFLYSLYVSPNGSF